MKFALTVLLLLGASAQAQTVLFREDFENGFANWTMQGLWNPQDSSEACTLSQTPFPSGSHCVWFGAAGPTGCNFQTADVSAFHTLRCTQVVPLPVTTGVLALRFRSYSEGENDGFWDQRSVALPTGLAGFGAPPLSVVFNSDRWVELTFDITRGAGTPFAVGFTFWAGDDTDNNGLGWLIDDVEILELPGPALTICAGDGRGLACPCDNHGGPGRGCASSLSAIGARIYATGSPLTSTQDLTLHMEGMSPAAATVFQATLARQQSFEAIAGDGLSCVTGSFIRLTTRFAPGGNLDFPGAGDASIVTLGMVAPLTTRFYAARYRDSATFCTPATFNITNTIAVTWRP